VDRARRRLAIKVKAELPGAAARDLEPKAYTDLNEIEKKMSASEARRLLYVALSGLVILLDSYGKRGEILMSGLAVEYLDRLKEREAVRTPEWFGVLPWAGLAGLSMISALNHGHFERLWITLGGFFAGMAWGLGGWHLFTRWVERH
jgi:hypothetical protein